MTTGEKVEKQSATMKAVSHVALLRRTDEYFRNDREINGLQRDLQSVYAALLYCMF